VKQPQVQIALAVLIATSCSPKPNPSPTGTPPSQSPPPAAATKAEEDPDCVRGEPVAVLQPARSSFRKISKLLPEETLTGSDGAGAGAGVQIRHSGCTAYALEFTFTWKHAPANQMQAAAAALSALPVTETFAPVRRQIAEAVAKLRPGTEGVQISETDTLDVVPPSTPTQLRLRYAVTL